MKKAMVLLFMCKALVGIAQNNNNGKAKADSTDKTSTLGTDRILLTDDIANFTSSNTSIYSGAALPVFSHKDATKGNRYLFDKWVKGEVKNQNGQVVANNSFLFNYDKIGTNFLITQDYKTVIELDKKQISSCEMTDGKTSIKFEKAPTTTDFYIILATVKDKYTFYKKLTTKFQKANYTTNGITESGHNYDEYIDVTSYYIYKTANKELKQVALKKKSMKEALPQEQDIIDAYFSQHPDSTLDEFFLIELVNTIK